MAEPTLSERLATGVPGLDTVLHGGLLAGRTFIVQGAPGTGKTILANQICFQQARAGRRSLYLTLAAESHDQVLDQVQQLSFYDAAQVATSIYYLSGFGILVSDGFKGILQLVRTEAMERGASLLVLDSLPALLEQGASETELRTFFNELAALARLLRMTILLLTNNKRSETETEFMVVDGWVEFGVQTREYHCYRWVQVHKYRRSDYLGGRHRLMLSSEGVQVFPRLEAALAREPREEQSRGRISSGVAGFDTMLGGGIPGGSTTLALGPTGIGKTVFGLHFIAASSAAEPGLVFGFYETPSRLVVKAGTLGLDLQHLLNAGAVEIMWHPPLESSLDKLGYRLLDAVEQRKAKRVFIDGIGGFRASAVHPDRIVHFLTALTSELRHRGVTTICTMETAELVGGETRLTLGPVSAVAENVVLLRYVETEGELRRALGLIKVRESRFDTTVREFSITHQGIELGQTFPRTAEALTGGQPHDMELP